MYQFNTGDFDGDMTFAYDAAFGMYASALHSMNKRQQRVKA